MIKKKQDGHLSKCTECGKRFRKTVKGFCSNICYELDLQKRVKHACDEDTTHTQKMS